MPDGSTDDLFTMMVRSAGEQLGACAARLVVYHREAVAEDFRLALGACVGASSAGLQPVATVLAVESRSSMYFWPGSDAFLEDGPGYVMHVCHFAMLIGHLELRFDHESFRPEPSRVDWVAEQCSVAIRVGWQSEGRWMF